MGTWCTVPVVRCVSVNRCSVLIIGAAPNHPDNQLTYRMHPLGQHATTATSEYSGYIARIFFV